MLNRFFLLFFLQFSGIFLYSQLPNQESHNLYQNYSVQQYTIENGLSDNYISAILQDRQGFIWIGTNDGLNRYDGYQFKIFKHQPTETGSISNNKISALLEDRSGKIWAATDGGLNYFDPLRESFIQFLHNPDDEKSLSHNSVRTVFEDSEGIIWIGTLMGLNKFDKETQTFAFYKSNIPCKTWECWYPDEVSAIGETTGGDLVIGFWGMGLMLFDKKTKTFQQIFTTNEGDLGLPNWVNKIARTENNWLVISTDRGLFKYEETKGVEQILINGADFKPGYCAFTESRQLLVGSQNNGLFILNSNDQLVRHFLPETSNSKISPGNNITAIWEDQAGEIWLGTKGRGLFHLNLAGNRFLHYPHLTSQSTSQVHNPIQSLLEVQEDFVWVGTLLDGIKTFNRKTEKFESLPLPLQLQSPTFRQENQITALSQDSKGNVWIGTAGKGLLLYQSDSRGFRQFVADFNDPTSLPDHYITDILETAEKEIWISTPLGIAVLSNQEAIQTGIFKQYKSDPNNKTSLRHNNIYCLTQAKSGKIWVGTKAGLQLFDPHSKTFVLYDHHPDDLNTISDNNVISIFEDSNEQLWVGTRNGLNKFDPAGGTFEHFTEKDGLPDGVIAQIQEDHKGNLWLGTKKGISRFNPNEGTFKNYDAKDGLFNYSLESNAFILSQYSGNFYAGGKNGLSVFHPDSIKENTFRPPVRIVSLKKYNTRENSTEATTIKGIDHLDEVEFFYQENIITFELAALNYQNPEKNQYAYKLEGFNDNWINIGTNREITFTNLDPGHYTLNVKGSNNDGYWNEEGTTLKIRIQPPWWRTWWAYVIYFLLAASLISTVFFFLRKRWLLRNELKREQEEANRLKELDTFKSRLYTNLTHEFRTPLSVILGMADQISSNPKAHLQEGLQLIRRNGQQLLTLINQLLDLSRLENNSLRLQLQQDNIIPYLNYLTEAFQSFANTRNLSLKFSSTLESLVMDYDPEQIKQIMTNLISNAVKFTPSGGSIEVKVSQAGDQLLIKVNDTGIGIAANEQPRIFDRFYQVDGSTTRQGEGTGIGLAHTQELVKLMKGQITVESALGEGTIFVVRLPIHKAVSTPIASESLKSTTALEALPPIPLPTNLVAEGNTQQTLTPNGLPQLLIIEDNPDVVSYLKTCLSDAYQLDVAYNGTVGIEKALENIPDLIISDVMMPEKDGYEVCNTLKNDERTSHIPIILLTAKADVNSKISGLKTGADAYLSKPFDKTELLVRLKMLVKKQKQLRAYYAKKFQNGLVIDPSGTVKEAVNPIEDAFLQKIHHILEKNISDEYFGLPKLCQKIGMSRSQLFRKMKALTDTAPSDYIRNYRLQKANYLLRNTDINVAEAAYEVGFKDPSYFSKIFQEAFGILPSIVSK